jgi:hypothetical protein
MDSRCIRCHVLSLCLLGMQCCLGIPTQGLTAPDVMPCMTASVTSRGGTVYMSSSSMLADQQQQLLLRVPAVVKLKRTASGKS